MKLDLSNPNYDCGPYGWVGHPSGEDHSDEAKKLKDRRADLDIIGGVEDEDASYCYDEFALVELDGEYYLCQTSGCSCPSPTETWAVDIGPATLAEIREFLTDGHYDGYTLPAKKLTEFLALIDEAAAEVST